MVLGQSKTFWIWPENEPAIAGVVRVASEVAGRQLTRMD